MATLITGATGTIGTRLIDQAKGDIVVTSRRPDKAREAFPHARIVKWDGESALPADALDNVDVVFHLAGEPVAEGRWTDEKKSRIVKSRVASTRALVDAIAQRENKPRALICGSAVGIYGSRGNLDLTEESELGTDSFLASVCKDWEAEAARAEKHGVRVVSVRIGVVLAREGGAFAAMLPLFKTGLAGKLGDGKQWMPWIHIDDIVSILELCAKDEHARGAINGAAPESVTNATFTRAMGAALHRPTVIGAPAFALRIAMGEKAEIILASQRVIPKRVLALGYEFKYPSLDEALRELVKARSVDDEKTRAGSSA